MHRGAGNVCAECRVPPRDQPIPQLSDGLDFGARLAYNHRLSSMSLLANGEFTRILCIGPVQVRIRRATTTWLLSGAFSRRLFAGSAAARR